MSGLMSRAVTQPASDDANCRRQEYIRRPEPSGFLVANVEEGAFGSTCNVLCRCSPHAMAPRVWIPADGRRPDAAHMRSRQAFSLSCQLRRSINRCEDEKNQPKIGECSSSEREEQSVS